MAKPPFQFKPSKALTKRVAPEVTLAGTGDVLASYSDVFVVTNEAETGMASIYFYQRQFADREVVLGKTEQGLKAPKAVCIARIILSSKGIGVLLEALAKNRGFELSPLKEEQK